jgi:hypothetical protein
LKNLPGEVLSTFAEECLISDLQKGMFYLKVEEEGNSIHITLSGELIVWRNDVKIALHSAALFR